MTTAKTIPVLVTTAHRGVFGGLIDPSTIGKVTIALAEARMAIVFGTTRGVMQLAETGPTSSSRISAKADIPALHNVTAVFAMTEGAWAAWQTY